MTTRDELELFEASVRGDTSAFGELVVRHQAMVCALAYSATGRVALSEEIAQETFLTAWRKLDSIQEPAKLRGWLCGVARNLSRRIQRRAAIESAHTHEQVNEPASPLDETIDRETEAIVWRALERVPEKYREVLVLYYREGKSARVVAEVLGLTEAAVEQRLSRGRRYLRESVARTVEVGLRRSRPSEAFASVVLTAVAAEPARAAPTSRFWNVRTLGWSAAAVGVVIIGVVAFMPPESPAQGSAMAAAVAEVAEQVEPSASYPLEPLPVVHADPNGRYTVHARVVDSTTGRACAHAWVILFTGDAIEILPELFTFDDDGNELPVDPETIPAEELEVHKRQSPQRGIHTLTDRGGAVSLSDVPAGVWSVRVRCLEATVDGSTRFAEQDFVVAVPYDLRAQPLVWPIALPSGWVHRKPGELPHVSLELNELEVHVASRYHTVEGGLPPGDVDGDGEISAREWQVQNAIEEASVVVRDLPQRAPHMGRYFQRPDFTPPQSEAVNDIVESSKGGSIRIVEVVGATCPYSARVRMTVEQLQREYPGKLEISTIVHEVTPDAAAVPEAMCAAREVGREAQFLEAIWTGGALNERDFSELRMLREARSLGMDGDAFAAAMHTERCQDFLTEQREQLRSKGIRATPVLIINGTPMMGAQPIAAYRKILEQLLGSNDG